MRNKIRNTFNPNGIATDAGDGEIAAGAVLNHRGRRGRRVSAGGDGGRRPLRRPCALRSLWL